MGELAFVFGIAGMMAGVMGYGLASSTKSRIARLEKQLKEVGVLDEGYKSDG